MVTSRVYPLEQPVVGDGGNRVYRRRQRLLNIARLRRLDRQPIRPTLRQDSANTAVDDSLDNAARHCLRVGDDDAAEADVDDLLVLLARLVNEFIEAIGWGPFLAARVSIIEKPVA